MTADNPDVKVEIVPFSEFTPQGEGQNVNLHTERGMEALGSSIQKDGWGGALTAAADRGVFDGSARSEVGVPLDFGEAVVVYTDGTRPLVHVRTDIPSAQDPRARRMAINMNRTGELNLRWNPVLLQQEYQEGLIDNLSFATTELDNLLKAHEADQLRRSYQTGEGYEGGGGDEFDPLSVASDGLESRVVAGDIWKIGPHLLICADSAQPSTYSSLIAYAGRRPSLVVTDPPYAVDIGAKNRWLQTQGEANRSTEDLDNDEEDEEAVRDLLMASFGHLALWCEEGASVYVCSPPGPTSLVFASVLQEYGVWRQTIVWCKNNSTYSPLGQSYHYRHELIYYGWFPSGPHKWYGGRSCESTWHIDRPLRTPEAPVQKPIELITKCITHASQPGEWVIDPFGGTGTTLVGAHRTYRRAMLADIDPHDCELTLRRAEAEGIEGIERVGTVPHLEIRDEDANPPKRERAE